MLPQRKQAYPRTGEIFGHHMDIVGSNWYRVPQKRTSETRGMLSPAPTEKFWSNTERAETLSRLKRRAFLARATAIEGLSTPTRGLWR